MDPLRWILFVGLILHKVAWEVSKEIFENPHAQKHSPRKLILRLIKATKIAILIFFLTQTLFLELFPIMENPQSLRTIGATLFLMGLTMAILGRIHIGTNWVDLEEYQLIEHHSLVTNGIYGIMRHPIYTGDLLMLIGLELALNSWLVLGVMILVPIILRQVKLEEMLLTKTFSQYKDYSARTARFIPYIL